MAIEKTGPRSILLGLVVFLAACSSNKPVSIQLMDTPEIYHLEGVLPLNRQTLIEREGIPNMLYVTDREPSEDMASWPYYLPERGHWIRFGEAGIDLKRGDFSWDEIMDMALLKSRSGKYPISLNEVKEHGALQYGYDLRHSNDELPPLPEKISAFTQRINERLRTSKEKSIYLYTHGYKVHFDNPVLVASELWAFLQYQGVFMAYSWPSTPRALAYSSDLETTRHTARHFRALLEFLSHHTDAEKIHVIGYSAGTRVVIDALWQLALMNRDKTDQQLADEFKIGQVLLMASDYDRDVFVSALADRLLDIPERLVVYRSETDRALGMASWLLSRRRLGEIKPGEGLSPEDMKILSPNDNLDIINVSQAERASHGKGHNYFRSSPWVSSDVLVTLRFGLGPAERGLIREEGDANWLFPEDYMQRLGQGLRKVIDDQNKNGQ